MVKTDNKKKPVVVGRVEHDEQNGRSMPVVIFHNWCKRCGICVEFCPKNVLEYDPGTDRVVVARPDDCIQCGNCELRCPDFAITRVKKENGNGKKNGRQNGKEEEKNTKET